jgi:ribonuclease P protein component
VLQHRVVLDGVFLRLYIKPVGLDHARIGLIVAKRIERGAVKRNRIKRLLREAFRRHQYAVRGLDCVMQLRRPIALSDSARIYQEAAMLLLKVNQS